MGQTDGRGKNTHGAACSPGHDQGHRHGHAAPGDARHGRRLSLILALVVAYMGVEAVVGWWSGSLALLADAGHMSSDAVALALALGATLLQAKPASERRTYGYRRAEVIAAFVNGLALVVISGTILWEAVERLSCEFPVDGHAMLPVAAGGLAVNLVGLWVLHGGHEHNLNVRGAWLHLLGDAVGSVGALTAGVLIVARGWTWADSASSILVALLVLFSAGRLLHDATGVLMEHAPEHLELAAIDRVIRTAPGVAEVHDLHVWTIGSGVVALSAHVTPDSEGTAARIVPALSQLLRERFGIAHPTIQVDPPLPVEDSRTHTRGCYLSSADGSLCRVA